MFRSREYDASGENLEMVRDDYSICQILENYQVKGFSVEFLEFVVLINT